MDGMVVGAGFLDPELPLKFETLSENFAKEKAKVVSLKQALSEAQSVTNQQDQKITSQNQRIRQFDFEQDSLLFRNNQLSKRVEALQEDLQTMLTTASTKKAATMRPTTPQPHLQTSNSSRSSSTISLPNSLAYDGTTLEAFAADLALKISENEKLNNEIFELNAKNQDQKIEFEGQICELRQNLDSVTKQRTEQQIQFDNSVQELEKKNVMFLTEIEKKSEENRLLTQELSEIKSTLHKLQNISKQSNEHNTQLIREKLPFIETEIAEFNTYNLQTYDHTLHNNFKQVFTQISNFFIAFCNQTSMLHSYLESSVKNKHHDPDSTIKAIQAKIISKLHRTKFYSKPIENCLILIIRAVENSRNFIAFEAFKDLYDNLALFVNFLRIIAKYHMLYLREESQNILYTAEIRKCNQQLQNLLQIYPIPLEKLLNIISVISNVVSAEIYTRLIENIQVNLLQLSISTREISLCFTRKFELEDLAKISPESADNQCIMTSLAGLINTTEKLMSSFTDSLPVLTSYGSIALKSQCHLVTNKDMSLMREKTRNYMDILNVRPPESLLYPVALSLSNQVFTYIPNGDPVSKQPNNRFAMQLQSTQNSLALVEREKENLAIEVQLLRQQQQQQQRSKNTYFVNDDSDKSTTADSDVQLIDLSSSTSLDNYSVENIPGRSADNLDQRLLVEESGNIFENSTLVDGERETFIRQYYIGRVTQLTDQLHTSECNSSFYYNEIKSISKHITHLQLLRKRESQQIQDSDTKIIQLQTDLESTQKGYERQLNVMSETMLSLNEQLSLRQEEIERLSSDLTAKKKPKNKS